VCSSDLTIAEIRALGLPSTVLEPALAEAMNAWERALDETKLVDRAEVFRLAAAASATHQPVLLLDVPLNDGVEVEFVEHLVSQAPRSFACLPCADEDSISRLARVMGPPQRIPENDTTALAALQRNLFGERQVGATHTFNDIFSAPGEARECVEIARQVLEAARSGVPFDRMAVLLRSPSTYRAPLEDAFRRALVPVFFAAGVPTPDPSGSALLALLRCAEEKLSARRFSEYLSLGQVPSADTDGAPPAAAAADQRFERADADTLLPGDDKTPPAPSVDLVNEPADPDAPVSAGRLRSPRKWEQLIIDAAVIGGVDRWRRRLDGLKQRRHVALKDPTVTEAQQQRFERELGDLAALEAFALPLLDDLAGLPRAAT
jgi:hypothetical protein